MARVVRRLKYNFPIGYVLSIIGKDGRYVNVDDQDRPNMREGRMIIPSTKFGPFNIYVSMSEQNGLGVNLVSYDSDNYRDSFEIVGKDHSNLDSGSTLSKMSMANGDTSTYEEFFPKNIMISADGANDDSLWRERVYKALLVEEDGEYSYIHNIERSLKSVYEKHGIVGDLLPDASIYPMSGGTKAKVVKSVNGGNKNSMIPINLIEFGGDENLVDSLENAPFKNLFFNNWDNKTEVHLYIVPDSNTYVEESDTIIDVDISNKKDREESCWLEYESPSVEEKVYLDAVIDAIKFNSGIAPYRLLLCNRDYPDNEYTQKLFQFVRKYFAEHPMTKSCTATSVFGAADTFGAHYYLGGVQQLYGARNGWIFRIGDGSSTAAENPRQRMLLGVDLTQFISNTGFDEIEFRFNKNHVAILDNTFSATKPSLWGTWNLKVTYDDTEKPYPYFDETGTQGFVPFSFVKAFRAAKISQAALDVFCKNTIWSECADWNGAWAEKLRCWHNRIGPAYGCEPYSEDPRNVVRISYHKHMDTVGVDQASMRVLDAEGKPNLKPVGEYGSLLETFMDSSITVCQVVLDCKFIVSGWQMAKTFATYRNEEGVSPMVEVRLKNLGNLPEYRFDSNGAWDGKNNTKKFSQASIDYLIDNLLDLTKYQGKEAKTITNGIFRSSSKIYAPPEWEGKISDERLRAAKAKGVEIYINNVLKN